MADSGDSKKPDWLPDWMPHGHSLQYGATLLQLLILGLAAGFLIFHLFRGNTDTAVGILGNQGT